MVDLSNNGVAHTMNVHQMANSRAVPQSPAAHQANDIQWSISRGATEFSGAHSGIVNQHEHSPGGNDAVGQGAHEHGATHLLCSRLIDSIIELCRMRNRMVRAEVALILQAKAMCRSYIGGDKIAAAKLYEQAEKGKSVGSVLDITLPHFLAPISAFARERKNYERQLRKDVKTLPTFAWVKAVRGFGDLNFALLIGEAGDIGSYRNPSALWKRMGMAVIDGERQRKHKDEEKAAIHGYSPRRRAMAYVLGDCLVKGKSRYHSVYGGRKAHTATSHPEWKPKHRHNDAMRFMTKRVLLDLWVEWRRCSGAHWSSVPQMDDSP